MRTKGQLAWVVAAAALLSAGCGTQQVIRGQSPHGRASLANPPHQPQAGSVSQAGYVTTGGACPGGTCYVDGCPTGACPGGACSDDCQGGPSCCCEHCALGKCLHCGDRTFYSYSIPFGRKSPCPVCNHGIDPNQLRYPDPNVPPAVQVYPYYTVRGPTDFFLKENPW